MYQENQGGNKTYSKKSVSSTIKSRTRVKNMSNLHPIFTHNPLFKASKTWVTHIQGLTVRVFQHWIGTGIGKNYRVGSGLGTGSGIGIIYWINRVLSGIEILDRVFPYFVIFNSLSTWLDIKFGIIKSILSVYHIWNHHKSKTFVKGNFSTPNEGKKVCTSQRQQIAKNKHNEWLKSIFLERKN